jgi:hypothetical protein
MSVFKIDGRIVSGECFVISWDIIGNSVCGVKVG